jgi:hypothetical protein
LLTEIKELSKKKQDGVLNEMKVKMANWDGLISTDRKIS